MTPQKSETLWKHKQKMHYIKYSMVNTLLKIKTYQYKIFHCQYIQDYIYNNTILGYYNNWHSRHMEKPHCRIRLYLKRKQKLIV